jgi:hypothetical protein
VNRLRGIEDDAGAELRVSGRDGGGKREGEDGYKDSSQHDCYLLIGFFGLLSFYG